MQHSIWKKGLVLGIILVFLGASTTLGMNTSDTNPQVATSCATPYSSDTTRCCWTTMSGWER